MCALFSPEMLQAVAVKGLICLTPSSVRRGTGGNGEPRRSGTRESSIYMHTYVTLLCLHYNDSCIKMVSGKGSHFNASLTLTTTVEERGEPKRTRTKVLLTAYHPNACHRPRCLTYSRFNPFTVIMSFKNNRQKCKLETLKPFRFRFRIGM